MHLGTLFGVPLYLNRWFLLMVFAATYFGYTQQGMHGVYAFNAFLFMLYICVAAHEYGHVGAGTAMGVEFTDVTLGAFGGVATLKQGKIGTMSVPFRMTNKQEFVMVIFGPLANVFIALLLSTYIHLTDVPATKAAEVAFINAEIERTGSTQEPIGSWVSTIVLFNDVDDFAVYLLIANLIMAVFNLLPLYPMDGGRLLYCFIRLFTGYYTARRAATIISQILCIPVIYYAIVYEAYAVVFIVSIVFAVCFLERYVLNKEQALEEAVDELARLQARVAEAEES